jgi:hypothetical protein
MQNPPTSLRTAAASLQPIPAQRQPVRLAAPATESQRQLVQPEQGHAQGGHWL